MSVSDAPEVPRVTMNITRGCLIATIQVALTPQALDRFQCDLLERLYESGARRVILDCSGVDTIDGEDFERMRKIVAMAALMGGRTVFAGLRPGVVSALVDLGAHLDGIEAAPDIDAALGKV